MRWWWVGDGQRQKQTQHKGVQGYPEGARNPKGLGEHGFL